jgi:hypothetical protein
MKIFKVLVFIDIWVVELLENLQKTIKIEGVGTQFGAHFLI